MVRANRPKTKFYFRNDHEKNLYNDKRIDDSLTIHQNQNQRFYLPSLNQHQTNKYVLLYKKIEGKKKKRGQEGTGCWGRL